MRTLLALALSLQGCTWIGFDRYQSRVDGDGDGVDWSTDCAPDDPTRSALVEGFEDLDGDGFGGLPITVCGPLDGVTQVAIDGDCDDEDAGVNPLADEICNGVDDDCDGLFDASDPGLRDGLAYFTDADNDGVPALGGEALVRCEAPAGYAAAPVDGVWDCDDGDNAIGPFAVEACDGVDNDCVGGIDDGLPSITSYLDADGDGFGTTAQVQTGCEVPAGFSANASDCDDTNDAISPDAPEVCNGVDDDCDGVVDGPGSTGEDTLEALLDADQDGFPSTTRVFVCFLGPGLIDPELLIPTDCDDTDASIAPGAVDTPDDGVDQDCSGADSRRCWTDGDLDGFGGPTSQIEASGSCGPGLATNDSDCDDTNPEAYPGAVELCDGVDQDCDGIVATDLISARRAVDDAGVVLWPGPLEVAGSPFDASEYREIAICGAGPWALPPIVSEEPFALFGHGAASDPRPVVEFSGPQPGLSLTTSLEVDLHRLHLVTQGRADTDPPVVRVSGASDVNLSGLYFDAVVGASALELTSVARGTLSDLALYDGAHDIAAVVLSEVGEVTLRQAVLSANTGGAAGALWIDSGPRQVDTGRVAVESSIFGVNASAARGGAISLIGGTQATLFSVDFVENTAQEGGALYVGPDASIEATDGYFDFQSAARGGAVLVHGAASFSGSQFIGNSAASDGGAILVEPCDEVSACPEAVNPQPRLVLAGGSLSTNAAARGGALLIHGGSTLLSGLDVSDNTASAMGGHVLLRDFGFASVSTSSFSRGSALQGGAFALDDSFAFFTLVELSENTAREGGALFGESRSFVTFDRSVARLNTATAGDGGAVSNATGATRVLGSTFESNTATGFGGAIRADEVDCESTLFDRNQARTGGAVYVELLDGFLCNFDANVAAGDSAGALYVTEGLCDACTFLDNRATFAGGAVFGQEMFTIRSSMLDGNHAGSYGGGTYGPLETHDTYFWRNRAEAGGGAFAQFGSGAYNGGNLYEANSAPRGGASYVGAGALRYDIGSTYLANQADDGGGVYVSVSTSFYQYLGSQEDNQAVRGDHVFVGSSAIYEHEQVEFGAGTIRCGVSAADYETAGSTAVSCTGSACTCLPMACPPL